jgi:hypothetical protein
MSICGPVSVFEGSDIVSSMFIVPWVSKCAVGVQVCRGCPSVPWGFDEAGGSVVLCFPRYHV